MKPTDTTPDNLPFDPQNPQVGQWAWKTSSDGWTARGGGRAVRIERVTKTGRVRIQGVEYRPEGEQFAHHGPPSGRFNVRSGDYLEPATPEQIAVAVELEAAEAERIRARRLERAAWRRRLNDFDFNTIDDNTTWQIARALGWTA